MSNLRRIMLIQPWDYSFEGVENPSVKFPYKGKPNGVLLLATQLEVNNVPVRVVDLHPILIKGNGKLECCFSFLKDALNDFLPDVVGVSFNTGQILETARILEFCHEHILQTNRDITFIAGGSHATIEPLSTLKTMKFDYAFVGEAEKGIVEIGKGVPYNQIKGVANLEWGTNGTGEIIEDLDSLPRINYELCDMDFYTLPFYNRSERSNSKKMFSIMFSRGCAYRCGFCARPTLSKLRFHSAEYVVEEINMARKLYSFDIVYFLDSSIGHNRKRLIELCEQLKSKVCDDKFEWYAYMRSDQVDEQLLSVMWDAGCRRLDYGFESGSQKVLDTINKKCTVEQNKKVVELHNKLNFPFRVNLLIGYPGETEDDIKLTIKFMKEHPQPVSYTIHWFAPLPGSESYETVKEEATDDLSYWRNIGNYYDISDNIFADVEPRRFKHLYRYTCRLARRLKSASIKRVNFLSLFDLVIEYHEKEHPVKTAIFGAGTDCKIFLKKYNALNYDERNKFEIIRFFDNDPKKENKEFRKLPVVKPDKENIKDIDLIIIASRWYEEIITQLKEITGPEQNIVVYKYKRKLKKR